MQREIIVILAAIFLFGCNKWNSNNQSIIQGSAPTNTTKVGHHLISEINPLGINDRPQLQAEASVVLVKLSEAPLFSTAVQGTDGLEVDPELRERILSQQSEFIARAQAISPEIIVLYRYRMILNGVALVVPREHLETIGTSDGVVDMARANALSHPNALVHNDGQTTPTQGLNDKSSVAFIGARRVLKELTTINERGEVVPIDGAGLKVGILDTGIDYTHAMLGGSGNVEDYESMNKDQASSLFPNEKVVGGIDLVGTEYNAVSAYLPHQIPVPDVNPMDVGGHGTHVAGTVAGIGNGTTTYDGVAPGADLYAIKVFGAGSTSDVVVIAGLEYAADPNGDGDPSDKLDVVNLSLGSEFGNPMQLYGEAVANLIKGGISMAASAGNSGDVTHITGSPSASRDALSVAASIDNMDHNYKFKAVKFSSENHGDILAEAVEGSISTPIAEAGDVSGELVPVGLADADLPEELAAKVNGKVALIDRGAVTFSSKLQRVHAAGAIGAVVANNVDGAPIAMGGDSLTPIPAIMITKSLGQTLKDDVTAGATPSIQFQTDRSIEKPELIDTLTGFSSKGPRSIDSLLKPEISAPGSQIVSADVGSGDGPTKMSGTSMAAPHIAGVMALLHQKFPKLGPLDIKALIMSTATTISDAEDKIYPIARQGAGRVQVFEAATQKLLVKTPGISLGNVQVGVRKRVAKVISFKNISDENLAFNIATESHPNMSILLGSTNAVLAPNETLEINVDFELSATQLEAAAEEYDGWIFLKQNDTELARIPVLAMAERLSDITAKELKVFATNNNDARDAAAVLNLESGVGANGQVLAFNLLAMDERKPAETGLADNHKNRICDLESAGFRVIEKQVDGENAKVLQIATKLYNPISDWQACQVSVQFDADGDGKADQELMGMAHGQLSGLDGNTLSSLLADANQLREIRKQFEIDVNAPGADTNDMEPDFSPALLDSQAMTFYNHSTIAVVEAKLSLLKKSASGNFAIKVAVLAESDAENTFEADDFLSDHLNQWHLLNPGPSGSGFHGMPEIIELGANSTQSVRLTHGEGSNPLILYMPHNRNVLSSTLLDKQSAVVQPHYEFGTQIAGQ
ncbi:MAG: serine protease [Bdellovibrionaceae bacterium]|nr:serine protease [Pseudobdellovibrionaceae bacterium]|tara:strand:+ start:72788 stop:76066 length:3279 start_codon:yes stop_codon:yes gene_type:complete